MLQRVYMEGLQLPQLYIAETASDARIAQKNGLPFIRWKYGVTELVRMILRPALEQRFPYIKWDKVLGRKRFRFNSYQVETPGEVFPEGTPLAVTPIGEDCQSVKQSKLLNNDFNWTYNEDDEIVESVDYSNERREFNQENYLDEQQDVVKVKLSDYIEDPLSNVKLEVLQSLDLLPKFVGDIVDCIKVNIGNRMRWSEGYNKKRGAAIGNFNTPGQLKNLIILDISASIPRGIAATMCSLIDTLRTQVHADLIITAMYSGFFPMEEELPSPQKIRDAFPPAQESIMFKEILRNHIAGHEWGNVITFGDNDNPYLGRLDWMAGTKVHNLHCYHTRQNKITGYAEWVVELNPEVPVETSTDWCEIIDRTKE